MSMDKEKVLIVGPVIGELGWELLRFVPHVMWKKFKQYNNEVKLIVITRPDRFDLYGKNADEFYPVIIKDDTTKMKADCWRLTGWKGELESFIPKELYDKYDVVETFYPRVHGREFINETITPWDKRIYIFEPREASVKAVENLSNYKPLITLAPRYREGYRRNWSRWPQFYDLLEEFKYDINFIVCGKSPEYIPVPDKHKTWLGDVNDYMTDDSEVSLIGLSIEIMKKSILTIGSQTALPHLSRMIGTPSLEWGGHGVLHRGRYNPMGTKIYFIDDVNYRLTEHDIVNEFKKILKEKNNAE